MRTLGVFLFTLLTLGLAGLASAKYVAVLETVCVDSVVMPLQERQFVTNVLRAEAVKALPADSGFTIMTRDNINAMLPPDISIEDCEGGCLVETGRNISADYVAQARIGVYSQKYTLTVELYETSSGKLVSSFTGRGGDAVELLEIVEQRSREFFMICRGGDFLMAARAHESSTLDNGDSVTALPADSSAVPSVDSSASVTDKDLVDDSKPQVMTSRLYTYADDSTAMEQNERQKKLDATRKVAPAMAESNVRTTLIVASALTTVIGVIGAVFADYYAKDASNYEPGSVHDYRMHKNDIRLAQNLRTVGTVMGIIGAVGLGFSIFF